MLFRNVKVRRLKGYVIRRFIVFHRLSSSHRLIAPTPPFFRLPRAPCAIALGRRSFQKVKTGRPPAVGPRFWNLFFLIAEAADGRSGALAVVPVHVRAVVAQAAVVGDEAAAVLRRGPELGVVARAAERRTVAAAYRRRTVAAACRNGGEARNVVFLWTISRGTNIK